MDAAKVEGTEILVSDSATGEIASVPTSSRQEKFDTLKMRFQHMRDTSKKREQKVMNKKMRKLARQEASRTERCPKEDKSGTETEAKFKEVTKYLDVNSHLVGAVSHGPSEAKSGLEEKINTAIDSADFETAENLSEQLAQRDMGVRLASAFAAKKYAEEKKRLDLLKKSRSKKKLSWGFEAKERWEIKGNM